MKPKTYKIGPASGCTNSIFGKTSRLTFTKYIIVYPPSPSDQRGGKHETILSRGGNLWTIRRWGHVTRMKRERVRIGRRGFMRTWGCLILVVEFCVIIGLTMKARNSWLHVSADLMIWERYWIPEFTSVHRLFPSFACHSKIEVLSARLNLLVLWWQDYLQEDTQYWTSLKKSYCI